MSPCPHCQRPVRHGETACPFCAGGLPEGGTGGAWQRLALGSAVIVTAATTSACPAVKAQMKPPTPSVQGVQASPSGVPTPFAQPPYGAAPLPSESPPVAAPAYGGPPLPSPNIQPPYGTPPRPSPIPSPPPGQ